MPRIPARTAQFSPRQTWLASALSIGRFLTLLIDAVLCARSAFLFTFSVREGTGPDPSASLEVTQTASPEPRVSGSANDERGCCSCADPSSHSARRIVGSKAPRGEALTRGERASAKTED
jgi:hypothetical protein